MADLSIRKIIEQVTSGAIRIPAFQRGFVWDAERVAYLMDSIYKGYPFGAVILWRTKEKLNSERDLGPFKLPEGQADYPVDYVLDGQQRITSIFGVFQSDLTADGDDTWTNIYFDMEAAADLQESQFLALPLEEVDPSRHFPIKTFFDVTAYRHATDGLTNGQALLIDSVQSIFKEATVPTQEIVTDDRAKVAIVFERVNRLGVELDVFQLLTAWTWSEDFDLQRRFSELAEELRPHGFGDLGEETNLLLRCCAAIVAGDASPAAFINLKGADVRDRFDDIENGIRGAIDFLQKNLRVETLANLPYPAALVPLSVFFARKSLTLKHDQREILVRWFWRSCFSRRYSAGVVRNLNRDIEEAANLREGQPSTLAEFSAAVDEDYFEQPFTIGTVNTRTFILLLAQQDPLSFVSGQPVTLSKVLQAYNRNEFHHLMPRAFLRDSGFDIRDINALVNFAIISASDNKVLGGVAPSKYKTHMPAAKNHLILDRALCPEELFEDDFAAFRTLRAERLLQAARALI
ncbi:GmrSD restriction endonuclease domain-containing protein [Kribbella sp. CA-247076]|uniref:GmrSD restriction endonuclease domain-containing protein n=1 Tax=Kribbella sp. CA-247076 TaxID=3239941 RepID=UPI003D8B035D